ncbi:MAG: mechanosensitive ion channel [Bdellovibrionales bacterium]|nr:mechanosensitive ion channel [Bdellovibrionales bacterium]
MKPLLLSILIVLSFSVQSQGIGSLLSDSSSQSKQQRPLPNLGALAPKWFLFLEELEEKEGRKNLSQFKTHMRKLYEGLDLKQKKEVASNIEKINFGLNYYLENKFKKEEVKPVIVDDENKKYSLKEYYTFLDSIYVMRLERNEEEFDISDLENNISEDENIYESLFASYLKMENNSAAKVIVGFRLVSLKIKLLIDKIKHRSKKAKFQALIEDFSNKEKRLQEIAKKISISKNDKKWSRNNLNQSKKNFNDLKKKIKDRSSKSKESYYLGDRSLSTAIEESYLKLLYLNHKLIYHILEVKVGVSNEDLKTIKNDIDKIKNDRESISKDLQIWEQRVKRQLRSMDVATIGTDKIPVVIAQTQDIAKEIWLGENLSSTLRKISYGAESALKSNLVLVFDKIVAILSEIISLLSKSIFTIGDAPVTTLGIINVILIIAFSLFLSRGIRFSINRLSKKKFDINPSSLYILSRLSHYLILSIGVMVGLSSIGIDFSNVALVAGALTVGIGFGLQSIFNNFVSGLILLFERPLRVGDYVQLESGLRGEVKEINVRSTRITTRDNIDVLVPNSEFINTRVINWTLYDHARRVHVPFGVAYGTDKELVKKAALEAASEVDCTITNNPHRAPDVWLTEFGDSSLNFELVVWVHGKKAKKDRVEADYLWELETKLKKYKIEIPFPQRDLHVKTVPRQFNV